MKYIKSESPSFFDEIELDDGRTLKCNLYWNDDVSFALDIGDGELTDVDEEDYFIHCEYNCDNGEWDYLLEIWFENDHCSIYDMPESERDYYLTDAEIEELKVIIGDLAEIENVVERE